MVAAKSNSGDSNGKVRQRRSNKAKKDKDAPTRPPSAYLIFTSEQRQSCIEEFKEKNGGVMPSVTELSPMLSQRWKGIDEQGRVKYNKLAEEKKEAYKLAKEEYLKKKAAEAPA
ncbi:MAG: non-histone protein [Paramarteilia canceri]